MHFGTLFRKVAPFAALAAAAGLSACGGIDVSFDGAEGVPLAELDLSGDPPTEVALGGPDTVNITQGDEFTIQVEGSDEAADRLRFLLEDGKLAIGRESGSWSDDEFATVSVTLPSVSTIALGGSGLITSDSLTGNAAIAIGGSGEARITGVDAERLEMAMGGSGLADVSGQADTLELAIGGSGTARMDNLQVGNAEIAIGGSGNATFASDGNVEASIAGSGTVRVYGSATCEANTVGSGTLVCEPRADNDGHSGTDADAA